jgi:hypothetical protein
MQQLLKKELCMFERSFVDPHRSYKNLIAKFKLYGPLQPELSDNEKFKMAERISLCLLSYAYENDYARSDVLFKQLDFFLKTLQDKDKVAFLWGRYFEASSILKLAKHVEQAENILLKYFKIPSTSAYGIWALGYYLAYKSNEVLKVQFLKGIETLTGNDKTWGYLLAFKMASIMQDKAIYHAALEQVKFIIYDEDALKNDFRAWALSILSVAAINMQDLTLYQILHRANERAVSLAFFKSNPKNIFEHDYRLGRVLKIQAIHNFSEYLVNTIGEKNSPPIVSKL